MNTRFETPTPELEREWETLATHSSASPFFRPAWVMTWSSAFLRAGSLAVVTARRQGELVGLLPVVCNRRSRLSSPTNRYSPQFGPLAADDEVLGAFSRALVALPVRRLDFACLPEETQISTVLVAAAQERSARIIDQVQMRSPYIDVGGDWADYWNGLKRQRRADLKRRWRRLHDRGSVSFDVHDGTENLDSLLGDFMRLESAGWKGSRGTAVSSTRRGFAFYTELVRRQAAGGTLRIFLLRLGSGAIAASCCLHEGGVLYGLKIAYDEQHRSLAPGLLLQQKITEYAFDRPDLALYDLGGVDDPWKLEWAHGVRERRRVMVFLAPHLGSIERASVVTQERVRARLPSSLKVRLVTMRNKVSGEVAKAGDR